MWSAPGWTPVFPTRRSSDLPLEAVMVTGPTSLPVTVRVATPATALAVPVPVTVPVPAGLGKGTATALFGPPAPTVPLGLVVLDGNPRGSPPGRAAREAASRVW